MTKLIAIAAVSIDGIIGVDNEIPWYIPEDFNHFRKTTMGSCIVVGYNTYLTLPQKAFEKRMYLVLNNQISHIIQLKPNVFQIPSIDMLMQIITNSDFKCDKVFVAGGAMIYESLLNLCDEAVITWINKKIEWGNKKFPMHILSNNFNPIDISSNWCVSKNRIEYKIIHYTKN